MAFPYLEAIIGFVVVAYAFETALDLRQHRVLGGSSLPPVLEGVVSREKFERARAYGLDKSRFHFLHAAVSFGEDLAVLSLKVLPWVWGISGGLLQKWGYSPNSEILQTLLFLTIWSIANQVLELPFAIYSTFVIETHHGFNKQTPWGFVKDMVLELALTALLGPPIIAAIITIVDYGGPYLALYLWLFLLAMSLVFMALYPVVIAPLFNKFTPLKEGSLRTEIEALAQSLSFPLKKLYVVDGSTRSSHSNAYMYGFYNSKRIVLYDTLIQQCEKNEEEIVAVVAHELGHWKLSHTTLSFFSTQVLLLLQLGGYTYVRNNADLFRSFGFSQQPILIGLILFQQIAAPLGHLVSFGMNVVSRTFEFQADAFAVKLGYAKPLRDGLVKLQEENLSAMNHDPWYSAYHYSHPPLAERLAAIDSQESAVGKKDS